MSLSQHVCAVIERETAQSVSEETPIESLHVDSLEFVNLVLEIEKATDLELPQEKFAQLSTVGDLIAGLA